MNYVDFFNAASIEIECQFSIKVIQEILVQFLQRSVVERADSWCQFSVIFPGATKNSSILAD